MSEEKAKKGDKPKPPVVRTPVEEVPPKKCDHKEKLEAVSAEVAELPPIVEKHHNIFRCKSCGEIVVTDKK